MIEVRFRSAGAYEQARTVELSSLRALDTGTLSFSPGLVAAYAAARRVRCQARIEVDFEEQ